MNGKQFLERQRKIAAGEFGKCPACGQWRPLDNGLMGLHAKQIRPEPIVCEGVGQAPTETRTGGAPTVVIV